MTAYDPKFYPFTASYLKQESKNGPFDIKHYLVNLNWVTHSAQLGSADPAIHAGK